MYDRKTVRRRRAVLGLLVACSLSLLTAYFGEGTGGGLHAVQRGVAQVLSPIESVASGALKPFRDFFGWFGDTFDAKKENKALKEDRDRLRAENIELQDAAANGRSLAKLLKIDQDAGFDPDQLVTARVVFHSPTVWFSTLKINKGTSAGIHKDDPVVSPDGLVGTIVDAGPNWAKVQLITDRDSGVYARVAGHLTTGIVSTGTPGDPKDLLMGLIPTGRRPEEGQELVTAGIQSSTVSSPFPPGIPIGVISKVDPDELSTSQQVHVKPYAHLRDLEYVQVLPQPKS